MLVATSARSNSAVGDGTLASLTTGDQNVAMGHNTLGNATTASRNTVIGAGEVGSNIAAGYNLTTGNDNTLIGASAGTTLSTGDENIVVGKGAAYALTTGGNNTVIGFRAGENITTAGSIVCLGNQAGDDQITTSHDQLYIARVAQGAGNAGVWIYGNSSGQCFQGGNSSSWSTTSDRRLKKNIVDNTKGLAEVNQLRVTNFEYRKEDEIDMSEFPLADGAHQVALGKGNEGTQTGIIAQEVEAVLPECINVSDRGAKTVNTDPITWALVNAVKELSAENDALKARLDAAGL